MIANASAQSNSRSLNLGFFQLRKIYRNLNVQEVKLKQSYKVSDYNLKTKSLGGLTCVKHTPHIIDRLASEGRVYYTCEITEPLDAKLIYDAIKLKETVIVTPDGKESRKTFTMKNWCSKVEKSTPEYSCHFNE